MRTERHRAVLMGCIAALVATSLHAEPPITTDIQARDAAAARPRVTPGRWDVNHGFLRDRPPQSDPAWAQRSNEEIITALPRAGEEHTQNASTRRWEPLPIVEEWHCRVLHAKFTREELARAIDQSRMIAVPPQYTEGERLCIAVKVPWWLPRRFVRVAIVSMQVNGATLGPETVVRNPWDDEPDPIEPALNLGILPAGTTQVSFRVTYKVPPDSASPAVDWSHDYTIPITRVDSSDPQPVNNPQLTDLIRTHLPLTARRQVFNVGPAVCIELSGTRPQSGLMQTGELARTIVYPKVEILRDGEVIESGQAYDVDEALRSDTSAMWAKGEICDAVLDPERCKRFALRVTGVRPEYLSMWHRTHYWTGTYTVPLADVLEPAE